jgi:hypothetical protein
VGVACADLCYSTVGAQIHIGQDIAHLVGGVAAVGSVAVAKLAHAIVSPAFGLAVFQNGADVVILAVY